MSKTELGRVLILVTGATGFVGRHLVTYLMEQGYHVRGTYRGMRPPDEYPASIEWVSVPDIGPETDWSPHLEVVDCVVHLAAHAHQISSLGLESSDEHMRVNKGGTQSLATAVSKSATVKRLVFVSSVGAVTSSTTHRVDLTTPCQPDSDYGKSKRAAEIALQQSMNGSMADWCVVRPPLVYGPGNPGNMARLMDLINLGIPLPLGKIQNQRSLIYIGNLISAIEVCLYHPGASRRVFLVSDGDDVSTPELVRKLSNYSDNRTRLLNAPLSLLKLMGKAGDLSEKIVGKPVGLDTYSVQRLTGSLSVDPSEFYEKTGWRPPYSLDYGLKTMYQPYS